jgi:hypothetical protein
MQIEDMHNGMFVVPCKLLECKGVKLEMLANYLKKCKRCVRCCWRLLKSGSNFYKRV